MSGIRCWDQTMKKKSRQTGRKCRGYGLLLLLVVQVRKKLTSLPGKCNKAEHKTVGESYQIHIHSLGTMKTHNHLLIWIVITPSSLTELQQFKLIGSLQNFLKVTAIMVIFSRASEQLILTGWINAAMYKNKREKDSVLQKIFCRLTGTGK